MSRQQVSTSGRARLERAGGGADLRKEAFARLAAGETARQIFEGTA